MNNQLKSLMKNLSFSFSANIITMVISASLLIIIPFYLNVENYGYWQLYIFYSTYIAFLSLGLTDGAYLRFGGMDYKELNKKLYVSQFWFLVIFDILINLFIAITFISISTDYSKSHVMVLACIGGVLVVPRSLLTFMLQATNRIKEYAIIIIIERVIYFCLVIVLLILGIHDFKILILMDLIGKFISLLYTVIVCKELVFGKFASLKTSIKEIKINITVGSKLLFSAFASMLIIGIVRFFIERNWTIEDFGKVSFSLSISSMLMVFISAIAVVLFPVLRRLPLEKLPALYSEIRSIIVMPLLGLLLLYFPISFILENWLTSYYESIIYLAILFPIAVYDSKMNLLVNTYLKTLRKEKVLLNINLITVGLSFLLSSIFIFAINNINLAILSITILLAFRSIIAELYLERLLNINIKKDIILEILMTLLFILCAWYSNNIQGFIIYFLFYLFYLLLKHQDITLVIKKVKHIIKVKK